MLATVHCMQVYALSWFERKLASTFIARLPSATVDDALRYFLKVCLSPTQSTQSSYRVLILQ